MSTKVHAVLILPKLLYCYLKDIGYDALQFIHEIRVRPEQTGTARRRSLGHF